MKNKNKGLLLGLLLIGLVITVINPITLSGSDKISDFEFSHFPQIEDKKEISIPDQIRIIAKRECKKRNLENYCVEDMLGMAWVESRFNCEVIGDFGASHGCFQIHQGYHKEVTQSQAEDLNFAIKWTLDRLIRKGYPEYRTNAIRSHNGSVTNPATLNYYNMVDSF